MGPEPSLSRGPHTKRIVALAKAARQDYEDDMADVFRETSVLFEEMMEPFYSGLPKNVHGAILCGFRPAAKVDAEDMTHLSMLVTPTWAVKRCLVSAVRALRSLDVIRSEGELR